MEQNNQNDDSLFEELLGVSEEIEKEIELQRIADISMVELKSEEMLPVYDEYYEALVFENAAEKSAKKPRLKDPKGGLTAAGRAYFKRKEGANLKPGVMGPANTPEKMRRKGSFLTRFFTNPSGPMKDEKGRATRLALSAAAWGEPVPKNAEDAAKLAAKGRKLLERYSKIKKKSEETKPVSVKIFNPTQHAKFLDEEQETYNASQKSMDEIAAERNLVRKSIVMQNTLDRGQRVMPEDSEKFNRMRKASRDMAKERKLKAALNGK